jgi:putative hydrolase of HD superfamily
MMMKQLLRTGWIRAGVPKSEIESLADHSWAVAAYTYFFCLEENSIRSNDGKEGIDMEKAVLMALFHDFLESEYMDFDKSINNVINPEKIDIFIQEIETNALGRLMNQLSIDIGTSLESLFNNQNSEEYKLVKISDYYDLLVQTRYFAQKHWINEQDTISFQNLAISKLKFYFDDFLFIKTKLIREGFLKEK